MVDEAPARVEGGRGREIAVEGDARDRGRQEVDGENTEKMRY